MFILIIIIGISLLILLHEFGHFAVAKMSGLLVEEFGFGFPPKLFSKKIGETTYSFNFLPFGGFVRVYGEHGETIHSPRLFSRPEPIAPDHRSFAKQPAWRRAAIIVAGVFMNFLLGWFLISGVFMAGAPEGVVITQVVAGSPAEAVGFQAGDQVLGHEDVPSLVSFIQKNRGQEIVLDIKRNGEELSLAVTPRADVVEGALGVALTKIGFAKKSFLAAIGEGFTTAASMVAAIFIAFIRLIVSVFTDASLLAGVVGPVGIFGVANQTGSLGVVYLFQLLAIISLNLAVLNILPFPALDGGRLLFIGIEKIKGSPISLKTETAVNAAGFFFLLLLMAAITIKDIAALF